jgi:hypothetical protein
MKRLRVLATVTLVLLLVGSASAIDQKGKWVLGAVAGYAFGFGDAFQEHRFAFCIDEHGVTTYYRQNKLTFNLGAKVKYVLTPGLALEGALYHQAGYVDVKKVGMSPRGFGVSESYDWTVILVTFLHTLSQAKKTNPNITYGLGFYEHRGDTELGINLGGGIEHFFQNNPALDAGARFHMIFTPAWTTWIQIYAGLMYYFEAK